MNKRTNSPLRKSAVLGASLALALAFAGCSSNAKNADSSGAAAEGGPDLSKVNTYLVDKATALDANTAKLQELANKYYDLAKGANFDYNALWSGKQADVAAALIEAKQVFTVANTSYESAEGIVAGVGELSHYDVDIDAGNPAGDGAEDVVSFDAKLPDGTTIEKPGNFFYLEELTLWGANPDWASDVKVDLDGNGTVDYGEVLPDANYWKGFTDSFKEMTASLLKDAQAWKATPGDALTALVVMVPTMEEYFQAWKESRFVSGDAAESGQFAAISRLSDIVDILSGLKVVYAEMQPSIAESDAAQAEQTGKELDELIAFVTDLLNQETAGTKFTAEQADTYGADAQNRATAIAGQITQSAAKMGIELDA